MPPLPRLHLAAYAAPAVPLAALGIPVHVHLPTLYADDFGLGLAATGSVLFVARLVDGLADPVIGLFCDRGGRWRRRGWMLSGLPLLLVAGWFLFLPHAAGTTTGAGVTSGGLLLWSVLFYIGLTLMLVPYQAWGADLSPHYRERTRIAAWREGFALLGVILALTVPVLLATPRAEALGTFIPLALLALALAVIGCVGVVPETAPLQPVARGWRQAAGPLLRNHAFRRLLLAQGLNAVANALPATLFLLFVGHGLGAPDWAGPLLLVYFCAAIAGVPLWSALARRLGKHRVWALSLAVTATAFSPVLLLGPGDVWVFAGLCVLTGIGLAADLALPAAILADVVDEHTAAGGGDRAGLYLALWSLVGKLALAAAVGVAFPLLDLAGFQPGASVGTVTGNDDRGGLLVLALLYGGVPVLLKLLAAAILWRFPLDEVRQAALRQRIDALSSVAAKGTP